MLMRVTWGKIHAGKWDTYEVLWKEHAKKTAGVKGLKGRYLLRDTETTDAGYSMTIWETAGDFEHWLKTRAPEPEMEQCFVGQFVTTVCDLRAVAPASLAGG